MSLDGQEREFEVLIEHIRRSRGFDFAGYKRASLARRVGRRLSELGMDSYVRYADYLEAEPDEFHYLFNTVLINVTSFFRDPASWDFVANEIVPRILHAKGADEPVRVWSPGCASGEEPFTAAIILAEALGEQGFRDRVKIYGTDVDEEALNQARQGVYQAKALAEVSPEIRHRYFDKGDHDYTFRKELRRAVIFGRHDLVQDPPISRIDLLICRNTLMYFNAETQTKILGRLHFALLPQGFLFLGKAEMLLTHINQFTPVDVKHRVFAKVVRMQLRERVPAAVPTVDDPKHETAQDGSRLRELALEAAPVGHIVVDIASTVVVANDRARAMFGLSPADIGRPLRDLEVSYRPVDLRTLLDSVFAQKRPVGVIGAEWRRPNSGDSYYLDVQVVPIIAGQEGVIGACITYTDVTRLKQVQEENLRTRQDLEIYTAELQAANEELETTNEELQSTNEELETTNEELQSANEELETMNEELQSTNEEMETTNRELQGRTEDLNEATAYLDAVLASLGVGVVVLDRELRVEVWNHKAADQWGLREDEVKGKHFYNLEIGLPVEQLKQGIRACLAGEVERQVLSMPAVDRRGRTVQCRVACGPLEGANRAARGVILLMETSDDGKPA